MVWIRHYHPPHWYILWRKRMAVFRPGRVYICDSAESGLKYTNNADPNINHNDYKQIRKQKQRISQVIINKFYSD